MADVSDGWRGADVRAVGSSRSLPWYAAWDDKRPRDRATQPSRRILGITEPASAGRNWMMGDDYSIADIAIFPGCATWSGSVLSELVGFDDFARAPRAGCPLAFFRLKF